MEKRYSGQLGTATLRSILTGLVISLVILCVGTAGAATVQLAAGGQALLTIVTAEAPITAEETAVEELTTYLQKMTGAKFAVISEGEFAGTGAALYVGQTAFAREAGVDFAALGEEEWVIRTVDGSLIITGGRPRGTLFGVYEFLEQYGGCAWLDEDSEIVPERPDWELPAIDVRDKPAFWSRSYYTGFSRGAWTFHVRNKHILHSYDAKYGYQSGYGSPGNCHTFYAYSKDWPDVAEYWAFVDGRRLNRPTSASTGQFCLTHPEVRERVLAQLREYIHKDRERTAAAGAPPPRMYDISHNDGLGYCLCPGCEAVLEREGAYSGVLIDFINEIARGIKDEYPDVLIQTFAYTFTLDPPRHIKPEDNVIIQVCDLGSEWYPISRSENLRPVSHPDNQHFKEALEAWAAIATHVAVWDYWKIYKITFPYTNIFHTAADVRFFRDNRVSKLFIECEDLENGSFAALKQWIGLKLMQNPDHDVEDFVDFFMPGYYGPAADVMREYLDYLQKRVDETPVSFGRRHPTKWEYFDTDFFLKVNELLDRAEALTAHLPECLARVQRERVPVDYAMLFLWDSLESDLPPGDALPYDKEHVIARYETNKAAVLRLYYFGDTLAQHLEMLSNDVRLFRAMPIALPEQFQGKNVIDLLWPDFPEGDIQVEDPDAAAGVAVRLGGPPNQPDFHERPLRMGLYDRADKIFGPHLDIEKEDIPQDGQYHFYRLGTFPIGETTIAWFHWTWLIQISLGRAYQPPLVSTMDVYASVKLVGPDYVQGSTDESAIYVDRIILVEAQ